MRLLSHPAVLAAIGLLAVNDHFLRKHWPSALTGKIGDLCWLFFFPALLAAVATAFAPARVRRRPRSILSASMAATALVFAGANTLAPVQAWVEAAVRLATGIRISITQDPTDLIALLAFIPLWALASRAAARPMRGPRPAAYLAITLGVLLSVANSAAVNFGIDCLSSDGVGLRAENSSYDEVFTSRDGGMTWEACEECSGTCAGATEPEGLVRHPTHPAVQYRYRPGEAIEMTQDGGNSWASVFAVEAQHEASEALSYLRSGRATAAAAPAPLDGTFDPVSGNAVFAMGHAGVLVHLVRLDRWEWVSVGQYGRSGSPTPTTAREVAELLYAEIRLAILLGLLAVATAGIAGPGLWGKLIAAMLPWAAFLAAWLASPALYRSNYLYFLVVPPIFAGYLAASLHVLLFSREQLRRQALPRSLGIALASAAAFLLPYLLWAYTLLPRYAHAAWLALAAGLGVVLLGRRRRQTGRPPAPGTAGVSPPPD